MILTLIAALAVQAAPAPAVAPTVCPTTPVYPAGFEAWGAAHPVAHGFSVGRAADLPVTALAGAKLKAQPSKPATAGYVATAAFDVAAAGTYRVAVGGARAKAKLWLDVASADGKPLTSGAHTHGGDCNSITKIVDFDLKPGRYTLLVTGIEKSDQPIRTLIVKR